MAECFPELRKLRWCLSEDIQRGGGGGVGDCGQSSVGSVGDCGQSSLGNVGDCGQSSLGSVGECGLSGECR